MIPGLGKFPGARHGQPTLVLLPGESHVQRSLAGCSSCDHKELNVTETTEHTCTNNTREGLPGRSVVKVSACQARDTAAVPGSGRSLGKGNGNPL